MPTQNNPACKSCGVPFIEHDGLQRTCLKNRQLQAENQRLEDLNRRAQAIITDAIMHEMPVTKEVAAVRNGIVRGVEATGGGDV